jgi:lipopolysaccharide/colanic/teichoic acid biosynthesis glycosyltransferase
VNQLLRIISFRIKRILDVGLALMGLTLTSPVLLVVIFLVWKTDKNNPFYVAERVGKDFKPFRMIKLRSMVQNADKSGVDSTSEGDLRITPIGHFIRSYKLDELTQLINVMKGDMSLVGPRPNVKRETDLYTDVEKTLLSVKPGITDFSSIVFSDEGEILSGQADPDIAYNQLIRPWKSRLGIFYIENRNFWLDLQLIFLTLIALVSRESALQRTSKALLRLSADSKLVDISRRKEPLVPTPPPGSSVIVNSRNTET